MKASQTPVEPRRQRVWLRVLLPDALVVIGAPLIELYSWNYLPGFRDLGYVLGLGSLVIFTFYGIWSYERTVKDEPGSIAMRDAIAATVVVLYLVLLSWAVFFSTGVSATRQADGSTNQGTESINAVTSALLTSFTSITAVVVAFYFGSVTVDQVTRRRQERPKDQGTDADAAP